MMKPTWHESLPPARTPAQIMLSVTVPTPFRQLHCLFPTTGTSTSCSVWGKGKATDGKKDEELFTHKPMNHRTHEHWNTNNSLTSLLDCTPASHPAISAIVEHTATRCQAHRSDVVSESDWWGESEQSDVVVVGHTVIVWVQNDFDNISGHLIWICTPQALKTKRNRPPRRTWTKVIEMKKKYRRFDKKMYCKHLSLCCIWAGRVRKLGSVFQHLCSWNVSGIT